MLRWEYLFSCFTITMILLHSFSIYSSIYFNFNQFIFTIHISCFYVKGDRRYNVRGVDYAGGFAKIHIASIAGATDHTQYALKVFFFYHCYSSSSNVEKWRNSLH